MGTQPKFLEKSGARRGPALDETSRITAGERAARVGWACAKSNWASLFGHGVGLFVGLTRIKKVTILSQECVVSPMPGSRRGSFYRGPAYRE